MIDAKTRAELPHGPDATCCGFVAADAATRRIDFVFSSPDWEVVRFGVLSDSWQGHHPSDHLPVLAELLIAE